MDDIADDVIRACQNGDVQAFAAVVAHYEKPLFAYVYRLMAGAEAEDMLQEVFLKAYRQIHSFDRERGSRFTNWIFRIAHNHCLSELRRQRPDAKAAPLGSPEAGCIADPRSPTPHEAASRGELSEKVAQAVGSLPEPFRSVFILKYYDDLSCEDIAAIMECSAGTVKSRLSRARERLAEILKDLRQLNEPRNQPCKSR